MYTDDDKPEMTMPKQIDVKATKPQNKHGQGGTRQCPIGDRLSLPVLTIYIYMM